MAPWLKSVLLLLIGLDSLPGWAWLCGWWLKQMTWLEIVPSTEPAWRVWPTPLSPILQVVGGWFDVPVFSAIILVFPPRQFYFLTGSTSLWKPMLLGKYSKCTGYVVGGKRALMEKGLKPKSLPSAILEPLVFLWNSESAVIAKPKDQTEY